MGSFSFLGVLKERYNKRLSRKPKKAALQPRLYLEELEPRLLLSAATGIEDKFVPHPLLTTSQDYLSISAAVVVTAHQDLSQDQYAGEQTLAEPAYDQVDDAGSAIEPILTINLSDDANSGQDDTENVSDVQPAGQDNTETSYPTGTTVDVDVTYEIAASENINELTNEGQTENTTFYEDSDYDDSTEQLVQTLLAANPPPQPSGPTLFSPTEQQDLTEIQLDAIVDEAIQRWYESPIAAGLEGQLAEVEFQIVDLPDGTLGLAMGRTILIDSTADGLGWYVDATASDDVEFTLGDNGALQADTDSPAYGRIDLLTVVNHELGHVLGLEDLDPVEHSGSLMAATLSTGQRRVPEIDADLSGGAELHEFGSLYGVAQSVDLLDTINTALADGQQGIVQVDEASVGGVLDLAGVTLDFSNVTYDGSGAAIGGQVSIQVGSAFLFPDQDFFSASIEGFIGSYDFQADMLSLTASSFDIDFSDVLTLTATTISFEMDTAGGDFLLTVDSASLSSPRFDQLPTVSVSNLSINQNGVSFSNVTLGPTDINISSVLTLSEFEIQVNNFSYARSSGDVAGTVDIFAGAVELFPGQSFFTTSVTGFAGSYDLQTGNLSLAASTIDIQISNVLAVNASTVAFELDPFSLSFGSVAVSSPRFPQVSGTVTDFVINESGFSIGTASLTYAGDIGLGPLQVTGLTVAATNFVYTSGGIEPFSGTIEVYAGAAQFVLGGGSFSTVISDSDSDGRAVGATLNFENGSFQDLQFALDTLTISISDFLAFRATGVLVDTGASGDEFVVSFDEITATLTAGSVEITGTGRYLGITASGSLKPIPGEQFGVSLQTGAGTGDSLKWPSWLPLQISELSLKWNQGIDVDPLDVTLTLSASINEISFLSSYNITVSGFVTGAQIDIGKLKSGQMPFVGLGAAGVSVSGNLFGGQFNASAIIEIIKYDTTTYEILASDASGSNVGSVFYIGLEGGLEIKGLGGVNVRVGISSRGPLSFYLEASVPITLDPNTGLTIDRFRGGVQFGVTLPEPTFPYGLRDPEFQPPGSQTLEQWREQLRQGVINQITNDIDWTNLDFSKMLISAGADLYTQYASKFTFRAEVDLTVDTTGKILINAAAVFADTMELKAYFYADLTKVQSGQAKMQLLIDGPSVPWIEDPVYSIYGRISITAEGLQVVRTFDMEAGESELVLAGGCPKPMQILSVAVGDPLQDPIVYQQLDPSEYTVDLDLRTITLTTPLAEAASVQVIYAQAFEIKIEGGAQANLPGGLWARLEGEVILSFTSSRFELDFAVSLEVSYVGQLGVAGGSLIINNNNGTIEFWGAIQVTTGEGLEKLREAGIVLDGTGLLQINTTSQAKQVRLRLPAPGAVLPYSMDDFILIDLELKAESFSLALAATAGFEPGGVELFEISGAFYLEISSDGLVVFATGTLSIADLLEFDAMAFLSITDAGLAGHVSLEFSLSDLEFVSFAGSFDMWMNTTMQEVYFELPDTIQQMMPAGLPTDVTVPAGPPMLDGSYGADAVYFVIVGQGEIRILELFVLEGLLRFEMSVNDAGMKIGVQGQVILNLFEFLSLQVALDTEIYVGDDPGIVLWGTLALDAGLGDIFYIEGDMELLFNTRQTHDFVPQLAPPGTVVPAQSFKIAIDNFRLGLLMGLLEFEGSALIQVQQNSLELGFSASLDFLGIATINASGEITDDPMYGTQFQFYLFGEVALPCKWFGVYGSLSLFIEYKYDQFYGDKVVNGYGRVTGGARVFGLTLASVSVGLGTDSNGRLYGRLTIRILFFKKTFDFTVCYLRPAWVCLASQADDSYGNKVDRIQAGTLWDSTNPPADGILYLNMGSRTDLRSQPMEDHRGAWVFRIDTSEVYVIEAKGPSVGGGENIRISGLGRTGDFAGVKKIIIEDAGAGNDTVIIMPNKETNYRLQSPIEFHGGPGDDTLFYDGISATGQSVAYGGDGNDYIWFGSYVTGPVLIEGGLGGDQLYAYGSGGATIYGGDDVDVITGGSAADTIYGGAGNDIITGGGGVDYLYGETNDDTFEWTEGDGDDAVIAGGAGFNTFNVYAGGNDDDILISTSAADTINITYAAAALEATDIDKLLVDAGVGTDIVTVNNLKGSGLSNVTVGLGQVVTEYPGQYEIVQVEIENGEYMDVQVPKTTVSDETNGDTVIIHGDNGPDTFLLSTDGDELNVARQDVMTFTVLHAIRGYGDKLEIIAYGGDDKLNASGVTRDLLEITLNAGDGDDTLVGSPFNDKLRSGLGSDNVTGGAGVDEFFDESGPADIDTLIETRDEDLSLFGDTFIVGTILGDDGAEFFKANIADEQAESQQTAGTEEHPFPVVYPLQDTGDVYQAGAEVESLVDPTTGSNIFEQARIAGGPGNNTIVVGDRDGQVYVGGTLVPVSPWTGRAVLDNSTNTQPGQMDLNEYYILNLTGSDGARITIDDTGGGAGFDELYLYGTADVDNFILRAGDKTVDITAGVVIVGYETDANREIVSYRQVERVTICTLGGDDTLLSDDNAVLTVIYMGPGDDQITVGTVPTKPDPENRTIEYPDGIPIADTEHMTNGNSATMVVYGGDGNDQFEVNHNRAKLYLHGGAHDDVFVINTFLVLREVVDGQEEVKNLAVLFGGAGLNRYEYLQNAPVYINGGTGTDVVVVTGTPIGDVFVVTENFVAGAGRITYFTNVEILEVRSGGGDDEIYVLSTSEDLEVIIRGGSGDDTIHLGGDHPVLLFDPPEFTYQPPAYQVQDPPQMVFREYALNLGIQEISINGWQFLVNPNVVQQAVRNYIQSLYNLLAFLPNVRLVNPETVDEILAQTQTSITSTRWFGGWWWLGLVTRIRFTLPKLTVAIGNLELPEPRTVVPPPITLDPPPFAFKADAVFDISDIKGRLTIDGGETYETDGDRIIVHNQQGAVTTGSLTDVTVPQLLAERFKVYEFEGRQIYVATNPEFEIDPQRPYMDSAGNEIVFEDIFVEPPAGATIVQEEGMVPVIDDQGQPVLDATGNVVLEPGMVDMVETLYQQQYLTNDEGQYLDGEGNVTSDPAEYVLAYRSYFNLTGLGLGSGVGLNGNSYDGVEYGDCESIEIRLNEELADEFTIVSTHEGTTKLILGGGDDRVDVENISGDTTILGGAGQDSVYVDDAGLLAGIDAELVFDGDGHITEVTSPVLYDPEVHGDLSNAPHVYVNSAPDRSFTDAAGNTIWYALPQTAPIIYADGDGYLWVRVVEVDAYGEVIEDYVQETNEAGELLWLDQYGNKINYQIVTDTFTSPPALIAVNRTTAVLYQQTEDIHQSTLDTDYLCLSDTANLSGMTGSFDTWWIPVNQYDADGRLLLHDGADSPDPMYYVGGEPAFDPITGEQLFYSGGEPVLDVFTAEPVLGPFGPLLHEPGDPVLHFAGDPVVHFAGEIARYLGGEQVLDENGQPVYNPDGSPLLHLPGQVKLHNRHDPVLDAYGNQLLHQPGDLKYYFGDELLQVGQPVVNSFGNLVVDEFGDVVLYTAETIVDENGDPIYHRRGEPVYVLDAENEWVQATYVGGEPAEYLGDEPCRYFGGEQVYYTAADPIQQAALFYRIGGLGMAGKIFFGDVEDLEVNLGQGDDTFTIVSTHTGSTVVNAGPGQDIIGVRSTDGPTRINGRAGDDIINVGSYAGLWETQTGRQYLNINGNVNSINVLLVVDGGDQDDIDQLNVDDTGDTAGNLGYLTFDHIYGLGMAGDDYSQGINYTALEDVNIALGSAGDTFFVLSTHTGTTTVEANDGQDTINVQTIAGDTTVRSGAMDDVVNVGTQTGVDNLASDVNSIGALLVIEAGGQTGHDTLNVFDSGDTEHNVGKLAADRLTGLGMGAANDDETVLDDSTLGITYLQFEVIELLLGSGTDELTIAGTADSAITAVHGGGGDDNILVTACGLLVVYGDTSVDGAAYRGGPGENLRFDNPGDDVVDASASADPLTIYGGPGDDTLTGSQAGDHIAGGPGSDVIFGEAGDDHIYGDSSFNVDLPGHLLTVVTEGQPGSDEIHGGPGTDIIFGDHGIITQTPGTVRMLTTANVIQIEDTNILTGLPDTIYGDQGNDFLIGGTAGDTIHGGAGNDLIFGDHALIQIDTAEVIDSALMPLIGDAYSYTSVYTQPGDGGGDDLIFGDAGQDIILGQQGADRIYGGDGDDDITGGHNVPGGSDTGDRIDGGAGNDAIAGDNATIARQPGSQSPRIRLLVGDVIYVLTADGFVPQVTGDPQQDPAGFGVRQITLYDHSDTAATGTFGDDYIAGGADNDMIFGQMGADVIQGDGSVLLEPDPASDVTAYRLTDGSLYIIPSAEAETDGDDYIEGNAGDDVIFGNLGQDDIIGGSSSLFSLTTPGQRPDGSDLLFGGAGTRIGRNDPGDISATGHARDADVILGDNGNIYRLVAGGEFVSFNYDNYSPELRIIARAVELLDYTPGGVVYNSEAVNDIGAADEIHGGGGDDFVWGQVGDDVLFGDGQDDDLIGGYGNDWISGGAGDDGVLGDDGLIMTSRNGTAEPLYGIEAISQSDLDKTIKSVGKVHVSIINVTGQLKKAVDLEPFEAGGNDIIYGGLGNDFLHGGAGDDAISGAEAMAVFYQHPNNPGNVLQFNEATGEFAAYDENDPMTRIEGFLLNFDSFTDPTDQAGTKIEDGDDVIFGDLGNDWLVGGTGCDRMYGGYGNDLLNADDNLHTNGGANNQPDEPAFADADIAVGGAGRDRLIANTGRDRLIDWVGEFNSYIVPFGAFGIPTICRSAQPQVLEYLYELSESDGADQTRADVTGGDPARNGEPFGELGLVTHGDADMHDQTGAPDDPQAGNTKGAQRDSTDMTSTATINVRNDTRDRATSGEPTEAQLLAVSETRTKGPARPDLPANSAASQNDSGVAKTPVRGQQRAVNPVQLSLVARTAKKDPAFSLTLQALAPYMELPDLLKLDKVKDKDKD